MTANGFQISFKGDKEVLELFSGDDRTITELHTLKGWIVWYVNCISI